MTGSRRPLPLPLLRLRLRPARRYPCSQIRQPLAAGHLLPTPHLRIRTRVDAGADPYGGCRGRRLRVEMRAAEATSVRALSRWLPARPSIKGRRARSDPREGIGGRTTAAACPPPTKLV